MIHNIYPLTPNIFILFKEKFFSFKTKTILINNLKANYWQAEFQSHKCLFSDSLPGMSTLLTCLRQMNEEELSWAT